MAKSCLALLLPLVSFSPILLAEQVQLQQPTATFSQSYFGDYSVGYAVNSNPGNLLGWAIYDPGAFSVTLPQTAVFETATDISNPYSTQLDLTLQFQHWNPQHLLGAFRISVTSDPRGDFADGLANGGDVTANWTVLTPQLISSDNGTTFTVGSNGSILAGGPLPSNDNYYIRFETSQQNISGIRIEALTDPSLPTSGPGRVPVNGNFVLTGVSMTATAVPEPSTIALMVAGAGLLGFMSARRRR